MRQRLSRRDLRAADVPTCRHVIVTWAGEGQTTQERQQRDTSDDKRVRHTRTRIQADKRTMCTHTGKALVDRQSRDSVNRQSLCTDLDVSPLDPSTP
ncbi:unnamed protein product [Protopolystoma xenopodis]|uniref:Uncharacterized protein n=1 Tax=Protopolystoma xenopodis TaxID=117903 RepID=A0A3S5BV73_9PLAT|nr:unnamed protein product [Protopolystoma xenopodis]